MPLSLKSAVKTPRGRAAIGLIIVIVLGFLGYYFIYMNNHVDAFSNTTPDLSPKSTECVVALFYADWCPHCVTFKPTFLKAKGMMDGKTCTCPEFKGKTLRFELVDCVANPTIAKEKEVQGFPTVKLFTESGTKEYSGPREIDSMNNYFFPQ